ncbi:MAG: class I SAM-dependent methyltransferase [Methanobacteriaceae archaeon]|nr:class I SAM-dependent methyltransferase [Methanobacteriaceae archaeon]
MAIKLSYDMKVYRQQLNEVLKENDVVVELGCHVGKSTEVIANIAKNGHIIAIDNSPEAISIMEEFSNNHENVEFISGDVRLHDLLEKVTKDLIDINKSNLDKFEDTDNIGTDSSKNSLCDVLSIDLGGGYHPDTVFKVFYIWSSTLKPRVTLIRNKGLIDFVNSIEFSEKIESEEGYLQSYENQGIPPQIKEFCLWSDSLKNDK